MFKKSFIYFIGQGLAAIIAIVLIPLYTKYLSPEEYGYATIIQITITYSSSLLSFGLNTGFMIRYWKTDERQKRTLFTIVLLFFFIVPVLFLIISPFYRCFSSLLGSGFNLFCFWLLGLTIFSALYFNFYLILLRNQLKAKFFVFFSVGNALTMALLNIYFIVQLRLGYWGFFYSMFLSYFLFAFIGTIYYRNFFVRLNLKESKFVLFSLLKIGWPILPAQAASGVLLSADRYILKYLVSESAVGIYSIGNKLGSLIRAFFVDPFFGSYIPIAYELFVKDIIQFKELQKKYLILTTLFLTSIVIVVSVPFRFLYELLINQRYWEGYSVVWIILLGYVFITLPYIITIVQTMFEKLKYAMWTSIFVAIVNIGLNFIFISFWGYKGAAITFTLSYFLAMILTIYINQKLLYIDYDWFRVFIIISVGVGVVLLEHFADFETFFGNILTRLFWACLGLLILYGYNKKLLNPILFQAYKKIKFSNLFFKKAK
ncbi:MAG: oligosaccharide flippase family protein [Bacteroidia bacterium]|jgi:O-antigen/teichoic acid export membrane protein